MRRGTKTKDIRKLKDELKDAPCEDCGGYFPSECMDWDHTDGDKLANVALLYDEDLILEEIEKCELVCANCHRIRTRDRARQRRAAEYKRQWQARPTPHNYLVKLLCSLVPNEAGTPFAQAKRRRLAEKIKRLLKKG